MKKEKPIILQARDATKSVDVEDILACFVEWEGIAPITAWECEADTSTKAAAGKTIELSVAGIAEIFEQHAAGPPLPKGEGDVIAFGTSRNGGSADADCDTVDWILFDDDAAGDLTPLVELLFESGIAFIAQRRGPKWHLHLPLSTPIHTPESFDPAWKKLHTAKMEWINGVFSELASLDVDLKAKKPVYGFDVAIPRNRVFGICYPYARRLPEDEIPDTYWQEGLALDPERLLRLTNFTYTPGSNKPPRTISLDEADGRRLALSKAGLIRAEHGDKLALVCPWSEDITKNGHPAGGVTSTVLFPNGNWYCAHETCQGRHWKHVDQWLEDHHPEAHAEAWRSQIMYNDKGGVKQSAHNVLIVLEHAPEWKGKIKYDRRARKVAVDSPPFGDCEYNDAFIMHTAGWMSKHWGLESYDSIAKGLSAIARKFSYDPVVDWLRSLRWDGVARLNGWLHTYMRAENNTVNREIGRRWMVSAVARAVSPGCQADHTLVMEGAQGIGKTAALRILGGPWYAEVTTVHGTAAMERLQGGWIMEMSELAATRGADIEQLKTFLTRKEDQYRGAYERIVETWPRCCVFAGTTNEFNYLDDTENRRIWPVKVYQCAFNELVNDRDQLFAEAVAMYDSGEKWHITDDEVVGLIHTAQQERRFLNPWEDKIANYLAGLTVTTTHKVMQVALGLETKDQARHYKAVGRIVRALGWGPKTVMRPGSGTQMRVLTPTDQNVDKIRWSDLGGPSLAVIQGGGGGTHSTGGMPST